MKRWLLVAVLCGVGFCLYPIKQAEEQNLKLAESLLGAENPCMLPTKSPTPSDPFYVSGVKIVAVIPQIGNLTSDLHRPRILWSWFAQYPKYAEFEIPSQQGCPAGTLQFWAEGLPAFSDGLLYYEYGNQTKQVRLGPSGPNPIQLELERPSHLADMVFEPLSLRVSGTIEVKYRYAKTEYTYECPSACICRQHASEGAMTYRKQHSDTKEVLVETGPLEWFWANPPLQKMIDAHQQLEGLFFARRMPSSVFVFADRELAANFTAYEIAERQGDCQQTELELKESFLGQNMSLKNLSEIYASQLVQQPAVYLPLKVNISIQQKVGRRNISIVYESLFSDVFAFESSISVREPAPFESSQAKEAIALRAGNDSVSPAAYPLPKGSMRVGGFAATGALVLIVLSGLAYEIKALLGKIGM
ncbi:MAG: hypothetical protein QXT25_00970 [Candidatus Anstonellaceae archaeon]